MKGRVLVADDSPTVVEMLKVVLTGEGHEVLTAVDGIMAAEAAFQYAPDVVVADVTMPRMNGYQLCRLLKNDPATADIPVVLLTSRNQARDRFWGTKSGADDYLIKDEKGLVSLVGAVQRLAEDRSHRRPVSAVDRESGRATDIIYRVNELLDQKLFEATVLNEIGRVGQAIENFTECADSVLAILGQFMDFAVAAVCFGGTEAKAEAVVRVNRPLAEEVLEEFQGKVLEALVGMYGHRLPPEKVSLHVTSGEVEAGTPPLARLDNFRAHPLRGGRSTLGLLATAGGPHVFRGEQSEFLATLADQVFLVLDNARLYRKVQVLAVSDEQTGLYNLRHFRDRLSAEVARALRYRSPLSLIMLDVDNFKSVNDRYGHPVGDLVLQQVAAVLQQQIRESDVAARYGGEEFAVILPSAAPQAAMEVAERLRATTEATPMGSERHRDRVTISLGVATLPAPDVNDMDDLVKTADAALYRAKAAGKNAVRAHESAQEPVAG